MADAYGARMLIRVGAFVAVLVLGVWIYAAADAATSRSSEVRSLPKSVWVLLTVLLPVIGSVAWFVAGRPRVPAAVSRSGGELAASPTDRPGRPARPRPVAPDDDPDFLQQLGRRLRDEDS